MSGVSSKCYRVSLYTQTICGTPGKEQKAGLDSGRKLKTSSWGGRARTAHLSVRVFPILLAFATLHGDQHLQGSELHPCRTTAQSGAAGVDMQGRGRAQEVRVPLPP